jgi:hypothetical protein
MDLIILGGIVLGLVELFKITFIIPARYIPIVTLIVTVLLYAVYLSITSTAVSWDIIQNGLIVALTAMGLWSGTKAVVGK